MFCEYIPTVNQTFTPHNFELGHISLKYLAVTIPILANNIHATNINVAEKISVVEMKKKPTYL